MKETKLSSKWASIGLYLSLILLIFIFSMAYQITKDEKFTFGKLFGWILIIALLILVIYQFKYLSSLAIKNNRLIFKKQFSLPKTYSFDKIEKISSIYFKNTKYTTVVMKNKHNTFDKYLVINQWSFLFKDKFDAEEKLKELREKNLD